MVCTAFVSWDLLSWMSSGLRVFLLKCSIKIECRFKKKPHLFIFREGEGREKKRERNLDWLPLEHPQLGTWPATQACAPPGNQPGNILVCGTMPSPLSHTSEGRMPFSICNLTSGSIMGVLLPFYWFHNLYTEPYLELPL